VAYPAVPHFREIFRRGWSTPNVRSDCPLLDRKHQMGDWPSVAINRLRENVPRKDLADNVMDQNATSGEFGLPTSTERAFYVQVAVPMRLPDAGRLVGSNLPHAGFWTIMTCACCSEHYVRSKIAREAGPLGLSCRRHGHNLHVCCRGYDSIMPCQHIDARFREFPYAY